MERRMRLLVVLILELILQGLLVSFLFGVLGSPEANVTYSDDYVRVLNRPSDLGLSAGEFAPVRMLVSESAHYQLDASFDHEWVALLPENGTMGYAKSGEPYSVAMFHQLRCLDLIRRDFGRVRSTGAMARSPHARSCLNYLRTSALCQSDMHIEGFTEEDNTESTHWYVCRDWGAAYRAAAQVRRE
ncbi:unnamed protein product [Peniophora sp. CBMAI 1063]|nr:unnamed protein product [Peniophora sp. CBMAI 1063]